MTRFIPLFCALVALFVGGCTTPGQRGPELSPAEQARESAEFNEAYVTELERQAEQLGKQQARCDISRRCRGNAYDGRIFYARLENGHLLKQEVNIARVQAAYDVAYKETRAVAQSANGKAYAKCAADPRKCGGFRLYTNGPPHSFPTTRDSRRSIRTKFSFKINLG